MKLNTSFRTCLAIATFIISEISWCRVSGSGLVLAAARRRGVVLFAGNLAALFQTGTDTFNSDTGVSVTLSPEMSGTDYHVTITPLAESGFIGEIVVSSRATNAFTVKCSGSDTTTTFAWKVSEV